MTILAALEVWHASMIEIIWTALGLVGMAFGWSNLQSSKHDVEALRVMDGQNLAQYRVMRVIAFGHFRNDLFRFAKHITITAIGALSMVIPPASPKGGAVTPTGVVVTGGLFTIVLLVIMSSVLDHRQREALLDIEDTKGK